MEANSGSLNYSSCSLNSGEILYPRKNQSKLNTRTLDVKAKIFETDFENREKSKLSCIIRKKYNLLIQEVLETNPKQNNEKIKKIYYLNIKEILKFFFDVLQPIVSIAAIISYAIYTYFPDDPNDTSYEEEKRIIINLRYSEIIISSIILLSCAINFIRAKSKYEFFCNGLNILDLV